MIKKQFDEKYMSMLKDVKRYLIEEGERLYKCGEIDVDSYLQDFSLAKVILTVALENCAKQYSPRPSCLKDVKNLRHF